MPVSENRSFSAFLSAKARKNKLPINGTFELSPVCNLNCRMCYVRKTQAEVAASSRPILTLDQWKELGDSAFKAGTLFLLLTGGEPFLWPDFTELYEYLSCKGFVLSINSNGTLITEETAAWLRERKPARINITLYGASNETYERLCGAKGMYDRVKKGIDALLKADIPVKLNASMTPYNISDQKAILDFAKERDLMIEMGTYMFPPIRKSEDLIGEGDRFTPEESARYMLDQHKHLLDQTAYTQYLTSACQGSVPPPGLDEQCVDAGDGMVRCQAGRGSWWITWDGWMLPCGMVPHPRADAVNQNFNTAWSHIVNETEKIRLSGVCESCKDRFICHSCMAMAYAETGKHSGIPRYLCRMAESVRQDAQQRLKELQT